MARDWGIVGVYFGQQDAQAEAARWRLQGYWGRVLRRTVRALGVERAVWVVLVKVA
jgi:hypothetical protein